jgi:hypothetical protein
MPPEFIIENMVGQYVALEKQTFSGRTNTISLRKPNLFTVMNTADGGEMIRREARSKHSDGNILTRNENITIKRIRIAFGVNLKTGLCEVISITLKRIGNM